MRTLDKYKGIFPAFYACYDENGAVCGTRTEALTAHLIQKKVKGLYVGGSSGECIYQSVADRKKTLEHVMKAAKGQITIIAHVACNNTKDSMELAAYAQQLGVDAIAAIPPIYFRLPEYAIAAYWNDISGAAPNTDFVIYNIPQLAGVALTIPLYKEMLKNKRVIGVKNSSQPVQDIQMLKQTGGAEQIIFNGPDEQLAGGLMMGADGGIGGTYGAMPELYLSIMEAVAKGDNKKAFEIQNMACNIIYEMCKCHGNLYAVMKEIIKRRGGIDCGSVRKPLAALCPEDEEQVAACAALIDQAVSFVSIQVS